MTVAAAAPPRVRAALAAAAGAGDFFRLAVIDGPVPAGWQPAGDDLGHLADSTASQLGTRETRVAASILHLGLAARLWSPVIGCALTSELVPDLDVLLIATRAPARLGTAKLAGWTTASPHELARLSVAVVGAQLGRIEPALPARLPPGLLRGNSASAMTGALCALVRASPRLAGRARQLATLLLSTRDLKGSGELKDGGDLTDGALSFRRKSCCLYYRVPGGGLCGDCCLERAPS